MATVSDFSYFDYKSLTLRPPARPELGELAASTLLPFAFRVLDWQMLVYHITPVVFVAEYSYLYHVYNAHFHTAGLFDPESAEIYLREPWTQDDVFARSVLLHESVHWAQRQRYGLRSFHYLSGQQHQHELQAYKAQLAYVASQGYNYRASPFFTPDNLWGQTHSDELFRNNYAWLEEYKP